jgi:hypothetical protein
MLGYDPIVQSYVVDHSPCGKTDGMGRVMRRLHHHYHVLAFNALTTV